MKLLVLISASVLALAACTSTTGTTEVNPSTSPWSATNPPSPNPTVAPSDSPSPTPGPRVLTKAEAATLYLQHICPYNELSDTLFEAMKIERAAGTPGPGALTQRAARPFARQSEEAARALADPSVSWPSNIAAAISAVATELYEEAAVARLATKAQTWGDFPWPRASSDAASTVRLGLDLPPRGQCPDAYEPIQGST